MAEFKKLSDVEVVAEPMESANVLIEEDGVIKKAPKTAVGGGEWDAKIYIQGGGAGPSQSSFHLLEGSYNKVIQKIKNKEVPKISIFWLFDYTGLMVERTTTLIETAMNNDMFGTDVFVNFIFPTGGESYGLMLRSDDTVHVPEPV